MSMSLVNVNTYGYTQLLFRQLVKVPNYLLVWTTQTNLVNQNLLTTRAQHCYTMHHKSRKVYPHVDV